MTEEGTNSCSGDEFQRLSDEQEKVLAILPIPSAALSILGSSAILYMALKSRERRKWTPYTRLLIGLSIYDIIASASIAIATFLRPASSHRAWTFGNDATCTASAFVQQLSNSAAGYNAMLSFYFLLTARFGLKNSYIARRFEPIMHFVSIGYYLGTAIVGAVLGVYADTTVGFSCYVNDYPRNCGHEPENTGEECLSSKIGWIFLGYPYIFIVAALAINNLSIYLFVRRQTRPSLREKKEKSSTDQEKSSTDRQTSSEQYSDEFESIILDDSGPSNDSQQRQRTVPFRPMPRRDDSVSRQKDQLRRLRLVSSQAFLFVANYLLVSCWSGMLAIVEQQAETREEELAASVKLYPLMVLNAIFLPLQGFFNMLVYIRPTYLNWRHKYPQESRPWAFRRAVFGESIRPQNSKLLLPSPDSEHDRASFKESTGEAAGEPTRSLGDGCHINRRGMISTLTASDGDFDNTIPDNRPDDKRLRENDLEMNHTSAQRALRFSLSCKRSGLEVISELSESLFEPIMPMVAEDDECNLPSNCEAELIPSKELPRNLSSKSRWSSSGRAGEEDRDIGSLALSVPKRWESGTEARETEDGSLSILNDDEDETLSLDSETRSSHPRGDSPIQVPIRRLSPPPPGNETKYSC